MKRVQSEIPSLEEICRQNGSKSPTRLAFEDENESVTWAEFDRQSRQVANALLEYAVQGDRVAFLCESSVRHVTALMGALKAGCVVSNLHTRSSTEMVRYYVSQLQPKVVVVDERYADRIREELTADTLQAVAAVLIIGEPATDSQLSLEALREAAPATEPDVLVEEDDPACIWWTSGSTGRPKGWCHTNKSLYVKAMKMAGRSGVEPSGTSLSSFSPSFGAWYNIVLKALIGCESVYFLREWDPDRWLEVVDSKGITFGGVVVSMWREVLDRDLSAYDLDSLEAIYTTGEKIDADMLDRLRAEVCENVFQTYGSTEMTGTTLYNEQMRGERIKSVGKPQMGTDLRIIEPDESPDDELPPGEVGEIIVRGPDVPAWAWRNTEQTRRTFRDGWWYSKDLGYKDEEGYVYLEGRADSMIKSKGVKIMPAPVEKALNDHPDVEQSAVVGVDDEEYGQRVTAIVDARSDDLTAEELDEWCLDSNAIADYKRPRDYVFTDGIEKTSSGKIDRRSTKSKVGLE